MIDLHTHVLPAIDDGPDDLEGSLELLRAAHTAGTRTVVATPHIDFQHGVDPDRVGTAVAALNIAAAEADVGVSVLPGAEIALSRLPELSDADLRGLSLGSGPYLLLEAPLTPGVSVSESDVFGLGVRGWSVLLAHPERSPALQRDPDRLRRLVAAGALCQITASALSGRFGAPARRYGLALLRDGLAHAVASDTHNLDRRPPDLVGALRGVGREVPGVEGQIRWLTREMPAAILTGMPLPERPALPARRGWRRLMSGVRERTVRAG